MLGVSLILFLSTSSSKLPVSAFRFRCKGTMERHFADFAKATEAHERHRDRIAREPQKFYFIRHGITESNEALMVQEWGSPGFKDHGLWDTVLSTSGVDHAIALHKEWSNERHLSKFIPWYRIDLVLSSPLTRALQTFEYLVHHTHPPLLPSHTPKIAHPLLRERLYLSSDVGRPRRLLETSFPSFDFSALPKEDSPWWYHPPPDSTYIEWRPKGHYCCPGEPDDVFRQRLYDLRTFLLGREEREIVVVAHWGVIRGLTGFDVRNCEVRAVAAEDLLAEPFIDPS